MKSSRKGSVLGACLVVALALTLVLAGLLKWTESEARLARATKLAAKADYAAEATGQFALAQMNARVQQSPIIVVDQFTPSGTPPAAADSTLLGPTTATVLETMDGGGGGLISDVINTLVGLLGGGSGGGSGTTTTTTSSEPTEADQFTATSIQLTVGTFTAKTNLFLDPTNPLYANDPLKGQSFDVWEVPVLSAARVVNDVRGESVTSYCEHILQVREPVGSRFFLNYNLDLEIHPGPYMEIHGPVHANGNIYVGSGSGLHFYDTVSTAKGIFHARAPHSGMSLDSGDVSFKGADGSQASMQQGSSWLDSSTSDWTSASTNLWGSNVMSSSHGMYPIVPAALPTYVPDDPATSANELDNSAHDLIEPAVSTSSSSFPGADLEIQKYAAKASIVVQVTQQKSLLGVPTTLSTHVYKYTADPSGTYVRRTGSTTTTFRRDELSLPPGLVTLHTFHDARQAQTVYAADVDVGVLKTAIENDTSAAQWTNGTKTFTPGTEWNGVVYVEHTNPSINASSLGAVRLVNGQSIPNRPTAANGETQGCTIATNAPLYIKGNYNSDGSLPADNNDIVEPDAGEAPAGVAGDAVTVLSTNWSDANSTLGLSSRPAHETEVSAVILTGLVPTNKNNNGTYSGGSENLIRLLENWSSVKFGYRGSLSVMYESETATSPWNGSAYSPPQRIWGLKADRPPGESPGRNYRIIGFRKLTPDEYQAELSALGGG